MTQIEMPGSGMMDTIRIPGQRALAPKPKEQVVKPADELLYDPPELSQYAKRGDPPVEDWPRDLVDEYGIMASSGDPRDWFRYRHRYKAAEPSMGRVGGRPRPTSGLQLRL